MGVIDLKKESNMDCLSLDEITKQLGTSKTNLKRAFSIERNLTDSMKKHVWTKMSKSPINGKMIPKIF